MVFDLGSSNLEFLACADKIKSVTRQEEKKLNERGSITRLNRCIALLVTFILQDVRRALFELTNLLSAISRSWEESGCSLATLNTISAESPTRQL